MVPEHLHKASLAITLGRVLFAGGGSSPFVKHVASVKCSKRSYARVHSFIHPANTPRAPVACHALAEPCYKPWPRKHIERNFWLVIQTQTAHLPLGWDHLVCPEPEKIVFTLFKLYLDEASIPAPGLALL